MGGITDLNELIGNMKPVLQPGNYVFCSVASNEHIHTKSMIGLFREREGTTVILQQQEADELGWTYDFVAAWITLEVHSNLHAVGLTAAFAGALAGAGLSCNVVAGFYHDHIFVPVAAAQKAMEVLVQLSGTAQQ